MNNRPSTNQDIDGQNLKRSSILVLDDEPINLILMEEILNEEGFSNVVYSGDPVEGLAIFEKETIDLILLDLKMPVMNGFEFLAKMQAMTKKNPPVLVLTASADDQTHQKVINANAQGIISKPFDFDDVLSEIESLLNSPSE